jgi:hypothetical protein
MSRLIAFLRAINVGGGRTVKMESLGRRGVVRASADPLIWLSWLALGRQAERVDFSRFRTVLKSGVANSDLQDCGILHGTLFQCKKEKCYLRHDRVAHSSLPQG